MQEFVGGGNQLAGRFDELRVVGVLPLDQMLDELKAAIARCVLEPPFSPFPIRCVRSVINGGIRPKSLLLQQFHDEVSEILRALRVVGIGDERSEHHRPARRQRPPRPPDVQRGDVPMPNRLLPSRLLGDFLQRQSDFYQSFQHVTVQILMGGRSGPNTWRQLLDKPQWRQSSYTLYPVVQ